MTMKKLNFAGTLIFGGSFLLFAGLSSCNNDSGDSKTVKTDTTRTMETIKTAPPDTSNKMKMDNTKMMSDTTHMMDTMHKKMAKTRPVDHTSKH